jgi:hypothetical protein
LQNRDWKDSSGPQDEVLFSISTSPVVGIGTAADYKREAISAASKDLLLYLEPVEYSTILHLEHSERFIARTHLSTPLVDTGWTDLSTALSPIQTAVSILPSSSGNPGSRPVSENRSGRSGDFVTVPTIAVQVNELSGFLLATSSWPTEFSSEGSEPSRSLQPPIPPGYIESGVLSVADTDRQPLSFPSASTSRSLAFVLDPTLYLEPILEYPASIEDHAILERDRGNVTVLSSAVSIPGVLPPRAKWIIQFRHVNRLIVPTPSLALETKSGSILAIECHKRGSKTTSRSSSSVACLQPIDCCFLSKLRRPRRTHPCRLRLSLKEWPD